MKRTFLTFILSTIFVLAYSQDNLKKITKRDTEKSVVERFYVLKNDQTTKHGRYQRKVDGKNAIIGQYSNNRKAGIWSYYDFNNTIHLMYDFDKDSVDFYIPDNDITSYDRPLLYFGSLAEARYIIMKNLRYPTEAAEKGKSGQILVDIYVDKHGVVQDYKVRNSVYPLLDNEAIRVVKLIQQNWIPALKNGEFIESKYTFPVIFVLQ